MESKRSQLGNALLAALFGGILIALSGWVGQSIQSLLSAITHTQSWLIGLLAIIITTILFTLFAFALLGFFWLRRISPTVLGWMLLGLLAGASIGSWLDRKQGGKSKSIFANMDEATIKRILDEAAKDQRQKMNTETQDKNG